MSKILRIQALLAALWAGVVLGIGAIAAPGLFAVLDRPMAGLAAGQLFFVEARVSLFMAIVLFVIERRRVRDLAEQLGGTTSMTINLLLVLGALFCTVFGEFAVRPMMAAAREGQATVLSFGALHGVSSVLFGLKGLMLLALAWRLTGPRADQR